MEGAMERQTGGVGKSDKYGYAVKLPRALLRLSAAAVTERETSSASIGKHLV